MNYKVWKMMECALFTSVFAFLGAACTNQKEQEPEDEVLPKNTVIKPDSAYRYNIASNGTETLDQITYYSYDKVGNLICQLDSSISIEGKKLTKHKTEMEYDSKSNMIVKKESNFRALDNKWHPSKCMVYTYDENNKLAQFARYLQITDTIGRPLRKGSFTWLDNLHAECKSYYWELGNAEWVLAEKVEYTYNEHGDIVKSVSYDCLYNKFRYAQDYSYDKYYNVISYVLKEEGVVTLQEINKYEYDSAGNILVRWYSSSSSETPPATPTAKYVYFY